MSALTAVTPHFQLLRFALVLPGDATGSSANWVLGSVDSGAESGGRTGTVVIRPVAESGGGSEETGSGSGVESEAARGMVLNRSAGGWDEGGGESGRSTGMVVMRSDDGWDEGGAEVRSDRGAPVKRLGLGVEEGRGVGSDFDSG